MPPGSGYQLQEYADFVDGTGPASGVGPRQLLVQSRKYDYPFSEMCYGENEIKRLVRGGNPIRQHMLFSGSGVGTKYLPGAKRDYKNPQRLKKAQVYMRYFTTHKTWVDNEILQNQLIMKGSKSARFEQYVDLDDEKEAMMWIDTHEKLDSYLFAFPDASTMEGDDGMDHMSLFAINNEEDNGLFGTEAGAPWTTVFGLSPTDASLYGRWAPKRKGYKKIADAPGATSGPDPDALIPALDELMDDVKFGRPKTHAEYWEQDSLRSLQIWTTKRGRTIFKTALRAGQDHWIAGPQDPAYNDPTMRGIPVKRVQELETAAVYYDSTGTPNYTTEGTAAESGAANAWYSDSDSVAHHPGPRFYLHNFNYTFPIFQDERFFFRDKPSRHHNIPDTWVVNMTVWHNIFCISRQHNGVLFPSATGLAY